MLKQLPNALTLARLVLAPVIAWCVLEYRATFWWELLVTGDGITESELWAIAAAGLFVVAALTDLFDGMAARAFNAHSKFGRLIDPIADKALVGLPLIAMSIITVLDGPDALGGIGPWWIIPTATAVIVLRDIGLTLWRLASPDGEGVRVSPLAKWKTAVELVAVGVPLVLFATPGLSMLFLGNRWSIPAWTMTGWLVLLVLAAALSAYTAFQYLTAKRA